MSRLDIKKLITPMKKLIIITGALGITAFVLSFFVNQVHANPSILSISYLNGNTATTTRTFLGTATATSTLVIPTVGVDLSDLNVQMESSSTASTLNFIIDFSDGVGCMNTTNSCDWFREDSYTVGGSQVSHAASIFHTWTPGTVSTTTKNYTITNVAANFMRVSYSMSGANGTIWSQLVNKSQRP